MELAKAIELLDDLHKIPDTQLDPDYLDAIRLGIEALKRYRDKASLTYAGMLLPLEGQTPPDTLLHPSTPFIGNRP